MTEAEQISDDFNYFSDGIRIVYLINREVNNTNRQSSRWVKKIITNSKKEYTEAIEKLLSIRIEPERIYASVNGRSLKGAIRAFNHAQADAVFQGDEHLYHFFKDVHNKWISCLSSPACKVTNHFIIDLDSDDIEGFEKYIYELSWLNPIKMGHYMVIKKYKTQNGWHLVTTPFDLSLVNYPNCEVKKDALLLLKY